MEDALSKQSRALQPGKTCRLSCCHQNASKGCQAAPCRFLSIDNHGSRKWWIVLVAKRVKASVPLLAARQTHLYIKLDRQADTRPGMKDVSFCERYML
eukprot:scaffold77503_cov20-Prasinocladus_malaysianus.AAC.1